MQIANVMLGGFATALLTYSGVGAMFGSLAALVSRRPADVRSEWTAIGGALGCVAGLLAMIVNVTGL
jgi:hypothetical protein